jgi:phosphoinositide-3-kinase regulatory subunit 4
MSARGRPVVLHLRKSSLGATRFLKSVKCRHRNGYVIVKIFIKHNPEESLRSYHQRLKGM